MANSIWEQRCLGLSETLCYRKRRGAMREDSARMVVWRGPWPVKRWNQGYAISWCEGLEPLLESPRGPAAVAERSKNSHRRDFTLGTQGGVKREIRSTSHSKAARSIPKFPWVPPITPSDLNCLPLPGSTQTAHSSVDKIVDTISSYVRAHTPFEEQIYVNAHGKKDIDIFSTNLSCWSSILGKFSMSFSSLTIWRSMVVKLLFKISADTVEENETREFNSFSVETHTRFSDMKERTQLALNFV